MTTDKKQVLHRIKIVKGHVSAIEKMIASDSYCLDIVHQSQAVQKALKKMDEKIIEDHLKNCVAKQVQEGKVDKMTEELLKIYGYK